MLVLVCCGPANVHVAVTLRLCVLHQAVDQRLAAVRPGHCGTLIYTSGTTGNPKACFALPKSRHDVMSRLERERERKEAHKQPININIFGGTVSGTNRNRPWDKWDPSSGQKRDPCLGQTGLSLFNSTVKSPFCPVCPWDGWGFVPGTIVPQGPSEKCICVFCLLFFLPKKRGT